VPAPIPQQPSTSEGETWRCVDALRHARARQDGRVTQADEVEPARRACDLLDVRAEIRGDVLNVRVGDDDEEASALLTDWAGRMVVRGDSMVTA